jgi:oligoendopeptidase F
VMMTIGQPPHPAHTFGLPATVEGIDAGRWESFAPFYQTLQERPLDGSTVRDWLRDWSRLSELVREAATLVYVRKTLDTTDVQREAAFLAYVENVEPQLRIAEQKLKERMLALVDSGVNLGDDMALIVRQMRTESLLYREENVLLLTELAKLANEYDNVTGALQTEWNGEPYNLNQLGALLLEKERDVRQRAWLAIRSLWLSQRGLLNEQYSKMLALRHQVATNAGLPDFRAYAFQEMGRFEYTPEDCYTFHEAIAEAVVPAASRIYRRRQAALGLERLRPWDVDVEPGAAPPLKPSPGHAAGHGLGWVLQRAAIAKAAVYFYERCWHSR